MRRRWLVACIVLCWLALSFAFAYFHWRMDRLERQIHGLPIPQEK